MAKQCKVIAVNVGTRYGQVSVISFEDGMLNVSDPQYFGIYTVEAYRRLYWNALRTYNEIQQVIDGILDEHADDTPLSIAVSGHHGDTLALVDSKGAVLGLPICYDPDQLNGPSYLKHRYPDSYQNRLAGLETRSPNLYDQLVEMSLVNDPRLDVADTMISLPDLYVYWISGNAVSEFSSASTTFLYDTATNDWARELLSRQNIPQELFPSIVPPGSLLGRYRNMKVITTASSQVAASAYTITETMQDNGAFLVAGNDAYIGIEMEDTITTKVRTSNGFNHQVSATGKYLLTKQIAGSSLIDTILYRDGLVDENAESADLLAQAAEAAPLQRLVGPDAFRKYSGTSTEIIEQVYSEAGQTTPITVGEILRSLLESLASCYAETLVMLEKVAKEEFDTLYIVGELAANELLCQMIADASGKPVLAGPPHAALLGNGAIQIAELNVKQCDGYSLDVLRDSISYQAYHPQDSDLWDQARSGKFTFLV